MPGLESPRGEEKVMLERLFSFTYALHYVLLSLNAGFIFLFVIKGR